MSISGRTRSKYQYGTRGEFHRQLVSGSHVEDAAGTCLSAGSVVPPEALPAAAVRYRTTSGTPSRDFF